MNPFDHPDQAIDVDEFIASGVHKTEISFKDFFRRQVAEEIIDGKISNNLKIYQIIRCNQGEDVEIIQAYNDAQAAYLFLLYETKLPDSYPFTERLQHCRDLGFLTPYDMYLLVIHTIMDQEIEYNDYLKKVSKLTILCP
jgi:hypothetical protein